MARTSGTFLDGHVVSAETCEKIRQSKIGCTPWNKGKSGLQVAWNKGIPASEKRKEKQRHAMTGRVISKETREKMSAASIGKPKSEITKQRISKSRLGMKFSEETCQRMRKPKSESAKKRMSKPKSESAKKNNSIAQRKSHFEHPELRVAMSIKQKKRFENPEVHMKNILSKYDIWYGGVKHYDTPQYCEKWTQSLRERVRAFFDYNCVSCGTPQNGRKLHVHHVNYNKNTCCDDQPRLLVALCNSCHMMTNNNKKLWEKIYTDIIQNYYEGRCFLTEKEMVSLNPSIEKFNYLNTYNLYQGIEHEI